MATGEVSAIAFPEAFPAESVAAVLRMIRSGDAAIYKRELAHHLWIVGGWLLNIVTREELFGDANIDVQSLEALASELEPSTHAATESNAGAIPWTVLAPLVIELIRLWLARRRA